MSAWISRALSVPLALAAIAALSGAAAPVSRATPRSAELGRTTPSRTISGSGSQTVSVRLGGRSPVVVAGSSSAEGRFAVTLLPRSGRARQLFDEVGPYRGEAALALAPAGISRLRVTASGAWSLTVTHPVPRAGARTLPARLAGTGSQVVPLVASSGLDGPVEATHKGPGRFRVRLIAYGGLVAEVLLFDQVGDYSGQTYLLDWSPGPYLVCVEAAGRWTVGIGS